MAVLRQIAAADGGDASGVRDRATPEEERSRFIAACGARLPLRFSIRDERSGGSEHVVVERPWAVIGADAQCDIRLPHPDISQRHAYLQVVDTQILCCDLGSRTGTHASRMVGARSWLKSGEPIYVGPYSIRLSDSDFAAGRESDATKAADAAPAADRPPSFLSFTNVMNRTRQPKVRRIKRSVTLVGWSQVCNLRLQHSSVGRVHCSLVWTPSGLWVVDLLGPGGTHVNGGPVDLVHLQDGDELTIGQFQMRVSYVEPAEMARNSATSFAGETRASISVLQNLADSSIRPNDSPPGEASETCEGGSEIPAAEPAALSDPRSGIVECPPTSLTLQPDHALKDSVAEMLRQQLSAMQQQLFDRSEQFLAAMARTISEVQSRHLDLIRDELLHIQDANRELQELNAEFAHSCREGSDADIDLVPPRPGEPFPSATGDMVGDTPRLSHPPPLAVPLSRPDCLRFGDPDPQNFSSEHDLPAAGDRVVGVLAARAIDRHKAELCQRIQQLEQEQATRWQEILQTLVPSEGGESD